MNDHKNENAMSTKYVMYPFHYNIHSMSLSYFVIVKTFAGRNWWIHRAHSKNIAQSNHFAQRFSTRFMDLNFRVKSLNGLAYGIKFKKCFNHRQSFFSRMCVCLNLIDTLTAFDKVFHKIYDQFIKKKKFVKLPNCSLNFLLHINYKWFFGS